MHRIPAGAIPSGYPKEQSGTQTEYIVSSQTKTASILFDKGFKNVPTVQILSANQTKYIGAPYDVKRTGFRVDVTRHDNSTGNTNIAWKATDV